MSLVAATALPLAGQAAVAATVPPRTLLITPTHFDFGEVFVGETSAPQEVVVTNVGAADVTLSSVSVGAPSDSQFGVHGTDCVTGTVLAPGASCRVAYTFAPAFPVGPPVSATSSLSVNGQVASIRLTGTGLEPFLVSPTGLDFGPVLVSETSSSQRVYVTNVSTIARPVTVTSTVQPGVPFATSPPINEILLPGDSVWVEYAFTPDEVGDVPPTEALVRVDTANGSQTSSVTLRGSGFAGGVPDAVQLTPFAVDFGTEFVGFRSAPIGATLSVFGSGTYTITNIADATSDGFAQYAIPSVNCSVGLQLSAESQNPIPSCGLWYTYTPATWGPPDGADVVVTLSDGLGGSIDVTLELSGRSRQAFLVTPLGFDFGDVAIGATAPEQTVTVTNVTTSPPSPNRVDSALGLPIGPSLSVTATGVAAPPFGGTTDCTEAGLAPGQSCTIDYAFSPTAAGAASATAEGTLEYLMLMDPAAAVSMPDQLVAGQPVPGVTATQPFTVQLAAVGLDQVAPTISVSVAPAAPAASGWYNLGTGAPTVSFTCTDPAPGSGIASCTGPTTLASGPSAQTVTGTAVDVAGSSASATSPPLLVDLVAPSIACPATPSFVAGSAATVTATVTDADSGPVAATVSATASTTGSAAVTLAASDTAGNTAQVSCPYVVTSMPPPSDGGTLPATGGTPAPTVALATALLGLGALLMAAGRRTSRL